MLTIEENNVGPGRSIVPDLRVRPRGVVQSIFVRSIPGRSIALDLRVRHEVCCSLMLYDGPGRFIVLNLKVRPDRHAGCIRDVIDIRRSIVLELKVRRESSMIFRRSIVLDFRVRPTGRSVDRVTTLRRSIVLDLRVRRVRELPQQEIAHNLRRFIVPNLRVRPICHATRYRKVRTPQKIYRTGFRCATNTGVIREYSTYSHKALPHEIHVCGHASVVFCPLPGRFIVPDLCVRKIGLLSDDLADKLGRSIAPALGTRPRTPNSCRCTLLLLEDPSFRVQEFDNGTTPQPRRWKKDTRYLKDSSYRIQWCDSHSTSDEFTSFVEFKKLIVSISSVRPILYSSNAGKRFIVPNSRVRQQLLGDPCDNCYPVKDPSYCIFECDGDSVAFLFVRETHRAEFQSTTRCLSLDNLKGLLYRICKYSGIEESDRILHFYLQQIHRAGFTGAPQHELKNTDKLTRLISRCSATTFCLRAWFMCETVGVGETCIKRFIALNSGMRLSVKRIGNGRRKEFKRSIVHDLDVRLVYLNVNNAERCRKPNDHNANVQHLQKVHRTGFISSTHRSNQNWNAYEKLAKDSTCRIRRYIRLDSETSNLSHQGYECDVLEAVILKFKRLIASSYQMRHRSQNNLIHFRRSNVSAYRIRLNRQCYKTQRTDLTCTTRTSEFKYYERLTTEKTIAQVYHRRGQDPFGKTPLRFKEDISCQICSHGNCCIDLPISTKLLLHNNLKRHRTSLNSQTRNNNNCTIELVTEVRRCATHKWHRQHLHLISVRRERYPYDEGLLQKRSVVEGLSLRHAISDSFDYSEVKGSRKSLTVCGVAETRLRQGVQTTFINQNHRRDLQSAEVVSARSYRKTKRSNLEDLILRQNVENNQRRSKKDST